MAGEGERTSPPPLCSLQVQRAPQPGESRRMPTRGWCGRAWGCRPRVGRERGRGPRPRRRVEKVCRQLVGSWSDVDRKCIGRRAHGSEVARKLVESPLGGGPMDRKSPGSWSEVRRRGLGSSGGSEVWPEVGRKLARAHGSETRKLVRSLRRGADPWVGSCSEVGRKRAGRHRMGWMFLGSGRESAGSASEGGPAGRKLLGSFSEVRAGGRAPGGSRLASATRPSIDGRWQHTPRSGVAVAVFRWAEHGTLRMRFVCQVAKP